MESKKTMILSVVAIATFAILIVGATYAYFTAQGGESTSANLNVTTYTTDVFTFTTGDAINIALTQSDFASGKGNAVGSTFAKASLTANNKTNTATEHYYLYLNIENNTFTYSINESTPEIIMTIKNSAGAEVTDISTLNHVIVTGANNTQVSGYDITNKNGLITLFNNREITTTSSKEEKWNITITFVNYDASQNANAGKSMSAKVMIQKEKINLLADYVKSLYTGVQGENSVYYHDSSLTNGAGDNSYRYAGASEVVNNFVCFGTNTTPCPTDNLYRIIGVFDGKVKLIKYDYATSALLGTDGDYYGTETPNSSYYKGSLTTINTYYWNNSTQKNTWSESNLNKVNLNTNFINNIGSEWANKIAITTWKVGGNTGANIYNQPAKTAYQNEVVNPVPGSTSSNGETEHPAKIGLMYASDYGFAAAQSAWTTNLFSYNGEAIKNVNWMYMGLNEWTISRDADNSNRAFHVYNVGRVNYYGVSYDDGVRPSFNLESAITYVSGSGSADDPILIN